MRKVMNRREKPTNAAMFLPIQRRMARRKKIIVKRPPFMPIEHRRAALLFSVGWRGLPPAVARGGHAGVALKMLAKILGVAVPYHRTDFFYGVTVVV